MQRDEITKLIARLAENHRRAVALVDEARDAVERAERTRTLSTRGRELRRSPVRPDDMAMVADVRAVTQQARALLDERREILARLGEIRRKAS